MITAVAAMDMNGLIGFDNELPWKPSKQKADIWRLRRVSYGHPIIMGWNTYKSLSAFKVKRRIIVMSTKEERRDIFSESINERHKIVRSIPEALESALEMRKGTYSDRTIIAGGASVYDQTIDLWDRLELTIIQHRFKYDENYGLPAFMPAPVLSSVNKYLRGAVGRTPFWVSAAKFQVADEHNEYPMAFLTMCAERHRQEVINYVAKQSS